MKARADAFEKRLQLKEAELDRMDAKIAAAHEKAEAFEEESAATKQTARRFAEHTQVCCPSSDFASALTQAVFQLV